MTNALIKYQTDHGEVKLSPNIVRQYLVSGNGNVTDQEVVMFINLCKYQGLNPFLRDAYLIKYGNSPATIVVGKDALAKRADAHPQYDGAQSGIIVQLANGETDQRVGTFHLPEEKIVGGWARVYRKDRKVPVDVTVSFGEYVGRKSDGSVNSQWTRMPGTMIEKVALSRGWRQAFPSLGGLYDSAEIADVDSSALDTQPVTVADTQDESIHAEAPAAVVDEFADLRADVVKVARDKVASGAITDMTKHQWWDEIRDAKTRGELDGIKRRIESLQDPVKDEPDDHADLDEAAEEGWDADTDKQQDMPLH